MSRSTTLSSLIPCLCAMIVALASLGGCTTTAATTESNPDMVEPPAGAVLYGWITINDPTAFSEYQGKVGDTFAAYQGSIIAVRMLNDIKVLEGSGSFSALVMVSFPSMELAQQWYSSPEYAQIRPIRQQSADSVMVFAPVISMPTSQMSSPKAYCLGEITVHDEATFAEYQSKVGETLAAHGGAPVIIAADDDLVKLEGADGQRIIVTLEFPSLEKAQSWYDSEEYSTIRPIRQSATETRLMLFEGGFSG